MDKNTTMLVGIGAAGLGLWLLTKSSGAGPTGKAKLTIITTPVAGDIFLGGTKIGTGGATAVLEPGIYSVSFGDVTGYIKPFTRSILLGSGEGKTEVATYTQDDAAARAAAAAELGRQALVIAQQAEAEADLDNLANLLIQADIAYRNALSAIREYPSTQGNAYLTQAEAAINNAQNHLVDGWNAALDSAIVAQNDAKAAFDVAYKIYTDQVNAIAQYTAEADYITVHMEDILAPYGGSQYGYPPANAPQTVKDEWWIHYHELEAVVSTKNTLQSALPSIKLSVLDARTSLNLAIERVLSITADIRLLNILISRINTVEASATALRNWLLSLII